MSSDDVPSSSEDHTAAKKHTDQKTCNHDNADPGEKNVEGTPSSASPSLPPLSEVGFISTWITYYFVGPLIDLCGAATATAGAVADRNRKEKQKRSNTDITNEPIFTASDEEAALQNTEPPEEVVEGEDGAKTIRIESLFELAGDDTVEKLVDEFDHARGDSTAYFGPAVKTSRKLILSAAFFQLLRAGGDVVLPIFIRNVINSIQAQEFEGLYWVLAIFITAALVQVSNQLHLRLMDVAMMRLRAVTVYAIYRHSMTLLPRTFPTLQSEVATLIASDAQRFVDVGPHIQLLWASPIQIILATYVLINFLSWPAAIAVGVMLFMYPISIGLSTIQGRIRRKLLPFASERTRLVGEYLRGVKVIKLYGWEPHLRKLIDSARTEELSLLRYEVVIFCFNMMFLIAIGHIAAAAGFSVFIATSGVLKAADAFATLAVLTLMKFPIMFFGHSALYATQCKVGIERIQRFLELKNEEGNASPKNEETERVQGTAAASVRDGKADEATPTMVGRNRRASADGSQSSPIVSLEDATFAWSSDIDASRQFRLHVPELTLHRGECAAVMGPVGSGKTMLCLSLLGETLRVPESTSAGAPSKKETTAVPMELNVKDGDGAMILPPTVAYAAQEPFLISGTIRDNIVFKSAFDETLYTECLNACQLWQDLDSYPDGEMTVVGERGVTLSGGQKARIALARAAYDSSDCVVLDDPFSALDARTGALALEALLGPNGLLKKKAVLFVTHAKQNLKFAQIVLHSHSNGKICIAPVEEVISSPSAATPTPTPGDSLSPKGTIGQASTGAENGVEGEEKKQSRKLQDGVTDALIGAEESRVGTVSLSTYWEYCVAAGGWPFLIIVTLGLLTERFVFISIDMWLAVWTSAEDGKPTHKLGNQIFSDLPEGNTTDGSVFYMYVYLSLVGGILLLSFSRLIWAVSGGHRQCRVLFDNSLNRLMACPMVFFDTTPAGRILNRMTHDVERTGYPLITQMTAYHATTGWILAALVVIAIVIPIALAVVLPTLGIVIWYLYRFRAANVHFQRLDAMARSSVQSHVTETIAGAVTIRAFGRTKDFIAGCKEHLNATNRAIHCFTVAQRWAGMRVEALGVLTISIVPLFCWVFRGSMSANAAGVAIIWGMHLPRSVTFAMTEGIQGEAKLVSVERLVDYSTDLPQEPPRVTPEEATLIPTPPPSSQVHVISASEQATSLLSTPSSSWPTEGRVEFIDVAMRYRDSLPLVLDGATVSISAGERVGIIGRTGAGKSSIIVALFRLRELSRGRIEIDGVDISKIGLDRLRGSGIGIIPQDPVLFSGTVRSNVDPFQRYDDDSVRAALQAVQLLEVVDASGGLNAVIGDDGGDWSVGQRQLFCVARALILRPKVLIMDEATASVDSKTDILIQQMVRNLFAGTTVIEIAHRLHTVMDADKVCVMSAGAVVEFNEPFVLLEDDDSHFSSAVAATGEQVAAELRQVAVDAHIRRQ